jgi:hypothetical protein
MSEFRPIDSAALFTRTVNSSTESHKQSVLNGPIKRSHKGLSPVNELAIKLVHYDLLQKPLTKCNSTWWIFILLVLSVGHVEDDKDVYSGQNKSEFRLY